MLEKEYLAALEKVPQVGTLPDPELGVGVFLLPVETRLGPQLFRFGATQQFPWKGERKSKKQLELAKAKTLYERSSIRALDLSYQLEQAYLEWYELEKTQGILERNFQILASLEQIALTKVESGKSLASDVLRVQLKMEELNQELIILERTKSKPLATINQLLNRPVDTPIRLSDSLEFARVPMDKKLVEQMINANHPMIRMIALQQDVSRQAINLNKLSKKPSFGVGLDFIMVNKRKDADPSNNGRDIVQLRGAVKLPIYKKKYAAKDREEQIKIEALDYQREEVLNRFMMLAEQAFVDYETARLKIDLYEKQMTITKAAINILETEYSANGNKFDELLRLEKELIDLDLKILNSVVQSHKAKSSIDRFILK